ncbi:MAG TPA: hypothetical protein VN666_21990 [Nitrospira sp.]|nr:hypothetical protein [Nitrospira sp.]
MRHLLPILFLLTSPLWASVQVSLTWTNSTSTAVTLIRFPGTCTLTMPTTGGKSLTTTASAQGPWTDTSLTQTSAVQVYSWWGYPTGSPSTAVCWSGTIPALPGGLTGFKGTIVTVISQ